MIRNFAWGAIVVCFCSFLAVSPSNDEVMVAAREGLPAFLKLVPVSNCQEYGFPSAEAIKYCTLGKPFQTLSLNPDFYRENLKAGKNYLMIGKEIGRAHV
mgnify:FL=1